ncbi:potassium ABC transporter ATPase [Massilia alkalitolerans]|nr:potassium ABC transporter ATPase [Massilia alkalitolerans]
MDVLFIGAFLLFFALTRLLLAGCQRLGGRQ